MRLQRVIDGRLSPPYSKGVVRPPESAQPQSRQPFEEDTPSKRTLTQPKTIRLLSPPSLETCDIFTMEPAFGRLPLGSRRTLLFHEPVAGLPGRRLRRAPSFLSAEQVLANQTVVRRRRTSSSTSPVLLNPNGGYRDGSRMALRSRGRAARSRPAGGTQAARGIGAGPADRCGLECGHAGLASGKGRCGTVPEAGVSEQAGG